MYKPAQIVLKSPYFRLQCTHDSRAFWGGNTESTLAQRVHLNHVREAPRALVFDAPQARFTLAVLVLCVAFADRGKQLALLPVHGVMHALLRDGALALVEVDEPDRQQDCDRDLDGDDDHEGVAVTEPRGHLCEPSRCRAVSISVIIGVHDENMCT